jgi:two-component system response regulator HydG
MYWGDSDNMISIKRSLAKIAPTDASVLITGENGTGKDLLAREVHEHSLRSSGPFVAVDAGAIPETLFESELFGHVKGAFTDAHSDHVGYFQQADGGTLFLDEVGNIPLHLQAKLLRVLQNRSISRLGDSKTIPIDIRLICATNTNLEKSVSEGRFREDLYYRINTVHFELPPLRERKNDIVPLAERFIKIFNEKYHRSVEGISSEASDKLREYSWSGNIRELRNAVEKAVILADGKLLEPKDFALKEYVPETSSAETLEEAEENVIREAMERYGGNLTKVAQALNISRPTLYKKLNKYNI